MLQLVLAAVLALAQPATNAKPDTAPPAAPAAKAPARAGDPYPFDTCPVAGVALTANGKPVVKVIDGREIRFCCQKCLAKFEGDKAATLAKLDEKIIKDQGPLYPLTTSVVSNKPLGDKPVEVVVGNRLVRLADESERAELAKDPAKYIAMLNKAAIEKQAAAYPMKNCVVADEELGTMSDIVDVVVAGRLVRLCCNGCKKDLDKEPAKYLAKVDAARHAAEAKK